MSGLATGLDSADNAGMGKKRRKRLPDPNEFAAGILGEIIAKHDPGAEVPAPPPAEPEKNPNAVALGRLGGLKGGPARAKKLTKKQLSEIGKKAARARWKKRS